VDTRYLIKQEQTPTVSLGPGMTPEMFTLNESVPAANQLPATKTLAPAIVEWCGGG
jgi:hypothetical protein